MVVAVGGDGGGYFAVSYLQMSGKRETGVTALVGGEQASGGS